MTAVSSPKRLGNLDVSLRFHTHPLAPCTIQVGGSPLVSAMHAACPCFGLGWVLCYLRGTFRGIPCSTHNDPTLPGDTAVLVGQGHTRDLTPHPCSAFIR
jgi:hypothetical protein